MAMASTSKHLIRRNFQMATMVKGNFWKVEMSFFLCVFNAKALLGTRHLAAMHKTVVTIPHSPKFQSFLASVHSMTMVCNLEQKPNEITLAGNLPANVKEEAWSRR